MRGTRRTFLIVGFSLLFCVQAVNTALLLSPDGARLQWPEPGSRHSRAFIASGDAWMAPGPAAISELYVEARRAEGAAGAASSAAAGAAVGEALSFPAERAVVKGGAGSPSFALPTWSARIGLPSEGDWLLSATAIAADGRRVQSASRRISVRPEASAAAEAGFSSWSAPHLLALAAVAALSLLLAHFARKGGRAWLEKAAPFLAGALWLNELAYQSYWMAVGGWSHSSALMLQMCGLSILCLPLCLFLGEGPRRRYLADVLYFWGIAGALQAMLTPDIGASGFPSYRYFSFFISHGLIVACVVALIASGSARITLRSLARCMLVSNIVVVPVYLVDRLLALIPPYAPGNYFAMGYPPPTGSPIDFLAAIFGPSPRYIVGLEIMAFLVFLLLWLPWGIASLRSAASRRDGRD
jgi:hypothetical integral membrane protein (TIGR02206 family)